MSHLRFHNPAPIAPVFVPANLPPRYVINFVPAINTPVSDTSVHASDISVPASDSAHVSGSTHVSDLTPVAATKFSIVSSANFVVPSSPTPCIGPN